MKDPLKISCQSQVSQSTFASLVLLADLNNKIDDHTIPMLLRAEEAKIRGLSDEQFVTRACQSKSFKYTSALINTIRSGVDIQRFNPLADLCNLISVSYNILVVPFCLDSLSNETSFEISESSHDIRLSLDGINFIHPSEQNYTEGQMPLAVEPQTKKSLVVVITKDKNTLAKAAQELMQSAQKLLEASTSNYLTIPAQLEV